MDRSANSGNNKVFFLVLLVVVLGGIAFLFYLFQGHEEPSEEQRIVSRSIKIELPEEPQKTRHNEAGQAAEKKAKAARTVTAPKVEPSPAPPATAKAVAAKVKKEERGPQRARASKTPPILKPWAVHIASFRNENDARRLERVLDRAGYNAYVTVFTSNGVRWYRVRIGFYSTKEEGAKVADELARRFKKPGAWTVRPAHSEVLAHMK